MAAGNSWWQSTGAECVRVAQGRLSGGLLLVLLFWLAAAASFSGTLGKWGLREREVGVNIESILDRTANKPLIYRRLIPEAVDAADQVIPLTAQRRFVGAWRPDSVFVRASAFSEPGITFRYALICHIMLLSLFASLFVLRRIAIAAGADSVSATLAPIGLVLAYPYLQTRGGHFYDATQLLCLTLAFLLAQKGRWAWLVALALPATLNKETFLFFLPALYPLLAERLPRARAMAAIAGAIAVAGAVNVWDRTGFPHASTYGDTDSAHWPSYLDVSTYTSLEVTYGMRGPSALYVGTLLAVLVMVLRGWSSCPRPIRRHLAIMAAINLTLVLLAGSAGELRNLSLLFVGLTVLGALGFDLGRRDGTDGPIPGAFAQSG